MKNSGMGQSVIISGESGKHTAKPAACGVWVASDRWLVLAGAGKTETSKIVMRYLAVVGGKFGADGLEGRMMKSNPILEVCQRTNDLSQPFRECTVSDCNIACDSIRPSVTQRP